jgi:CheY-like chemotaxis protein
VPRYLYLASGPQARYKDERVTTDTVRHPPNFCGLSVLVVDDDKDSRTFLSEVLRACDAIVLEADNIATAKAYVSTHKLNLVVTDLALPGEDGATFLKWLRQEPRERGGRVPAVVVTAFYEDYPLSEVAGWAAYFQKPVDMNQFVETVATILKVPREPGMSS